MKIFKIFFYLIISFVAFILFFLAYFTFKDYNPEERILLYKSNDPDTLTDAIYTVISWNIGYCGLNDKMDFFYDGGKNVYPEKEIVLNNLRNIVDTLEKFYRYCDFVFLQEVDLNSKRSYYINQISEIQKKIDDVKLLFALNYNVKFVPVPFYKPMGRVESGIAILTKYKPLIAYRISLPSDYPWPKKLFMLDRCCILSYIPIKKGKYLVLINTHNSAYDDGQLRILQNQEIKKIMLNEYKKGNFVIVGGDWNQIPPGFKPKYNNEFYDSTYYSMSIPKNFPDVNWL